MKSKEPLHSILQLIIKETQYGFYCMEIQSLQSSKAIPKESSIISLSPYLDEGILHIGGCANAAALPKETKTPILIPGKSHIVQLLVHHFHVKVCHQGRHLAEGSIRNTGSQVESG